MIIELKDVLLLVVGLALGLLLGIAIYWLPLGQFKNELRALWNLTRKRFRQGDKVRIKSGVDLKPIDSRLDIATTGGNVQDMLVWNDEGISWHHTPNGWIRARVIHVAKESEEISPVYKVSHLDIAK
ncbi:MAG: hypothetical protein H6622_07695 [Halobacteriovoraceae bacterium]|nr:hypothetical protein [Halobacteriovoraceae bacterium]